MNPVIEAVRQKYPGVYDDLNDDQLTLAIGKKADGAYDDIKEFSDDFTRVSHGMNVGQMMLSQAEFEQQPLPPVELPEFGKPGTFTRGISKGVTETVKGLTTPEGYLLGSAMAIPVVGPVVGTGMSAYALYQANQKVREALEKGSPEAAGEAAVLGGLGAVGMGFGLRGMAGPRVAEPAPARPRSPSPLPRAAQQAAKDFEPSFTIPVEEKPKLPAPEREAPKPTPAPETPAAAVQPKAAKPPATKASIASRILQKFGLDPETADRFGVWVSARAAGETLEAFRDSVVAQFQQAGLRVPSQISMYRTDPAHYEGMGFTPEQVTEHVRNAESANRQAASDVQAANRKILEQLEKPEEPKPAPAAPENDKTGARNVTPPEPSPTAPAEPIGLFRDVKQDQSLKVISDDEFYAEKKQVDKELDDAETAFDESGKSASELTAEERHQLGILQDRYSAFELESFRRRRTNVVAPELFDELLDLAFHLDPNKGLPALQGNESFQKFSILLDILKVRKSEPFVDELLGKQLSRSADMREVYGWKFEKAKKLAALLEPTPAPAQAAAKVEAEVKAVARTEGQRPAKEVKNELVDRLQRAIDVAPTENEVAAKSYTTVQGKTVTSADRAETVTIDIPGDGVFTIRNTKEALEGILKRAKKISTTSTEPKVRFPKGAIESSEKALDKAEQAKATELQKNVKINQENARASLYDAINKSEDEGIVGTSKPEEDPQIDGGTLWREWRIRKATPEERTQHWKGTKAEIRWVGERRVVKFSKEKGRTENEWLFDDSGKTRADVIRGMEANMPQDATLQDPGLKNWRDLEKMEGGYSFLREGKTEPSAQGPGMPKGEIRPGPKPYDPSSQALGIRPPMSQFMREDVLPAVQTAVSGITESLEGLRNLLSPVSAGPKARLGAGIIREHAGRLAQKDVQMREKFGAARSAMQKLDRPATLDWLDAVETGQRGTLTGPLRTFADESRAALNDRLRQIQALGTGKLQNFIQDYFPHLWKDPNSTIGWLQRIMGKRPLRGPASFLKHRTIPTTREGVDAGLEPVSWNPMDILLAKLHEMDRYVMGQKIFQEYKDKGLAKFSRSDIPPQGYARIDDRIGNVVEYRPTVKADGTPGAPERILHGHWYAQEDAARVLNNFLSPGLERYAWYKALRWVGNNMNMATLGLSGYHGMFTMIDAGTSKLALGIEQASRGQPIAAATIPRGLAGTLAANQIEAFVKGSKVLQEYTRPGSIGGETAKIVDSLIAGGGRTQMPEIYQNSTLRNFMDAVRKGNYTGAVLRAPAAALHAFAYPLMNVVVPRLKLGVFFDMARMELERLGPNASRDDVRAIMGKVWDSVDNRMGELVYDNLFWNKILKDLLFLAIRSVGWNLGTLRELGGGVLDSATVLKRIQKGEPFLTRRMAYVIALPFTVGLMGALYQYLRTGKGPQELRDYFSPKTGNTLPEGQPERVNFPSYLKDVESVKRHPAQTVIHKMHPMWGTIAEMLQNKDYYGTEIIHPGDPLVKKVGDELKFIAKSFVPYGVTGAEKRGKIEPGLEPKVESFFGIMPVPAELTRTPAENLAIELMAGHRPQAARTQAEFDRSQKERDAIQQIKMGKMTLAQARTQGLIEPGRAREVATRLKSNYLDYAMKHLSVDEAFRVLEKANPKELVTTTAELRGRIMRSTTIPLKDKQAYFKMLNELKKGK